MSGVVDLSLVERFREPNTSCFSPGHVEALFGLRTQDLAERALCTAIRPTPAHKRRSSRNAGRSPQCHALSRQCACMTIIWRTIGDPPCPPREAESTLTNRYQTKVPETVRVGHCGWASATASRRGAGHPRLDSTCHPLFLAQLEALAAEVETPRHKDPVGYARKNASKSPADVERHVSLAHAFEETK